MLPSASSATKDGLCMARKCLPQPTSSLARPLLLGPVASSVLQPLLIPYAHQEACVEPDHVKCP